MGGDEIPSAGVLTAATGLDEAGSTCGVTEVELLVRPGEAVDTLESSASRVAYARAIAETADEALFAAREAVTCIQFHLRVCVSNEVTV
ncbi:hypothetical protein K4749_12245 [Streptomyces sp. TRM72054]|uniref:hypothetical protein n=1 Tax=Streptomyces sp. TRM72054 TaxID=2870562 RepID=UPI001C8B58F6|nr:hypothetical protein [Streptomyces sp. TRM72054]MBX9394351.1 hypothetical protein [Streptomyces sp. TRM72054]